MKLNYDIQKIDNALKDFYNATDISIRLIDLDLNYISTKTDTTKSYCKYIQTTRKGGAACRKSDNSLLERCKQTKQPQSHTCHAGLTDIAVPLIYNGDIIGYIIMGQIKRTDDFDSVKAYLKSLGINEKEVSAYYHSLPTLTDERVKGITNIAVMLAKYLLLEDLLKPHSNNNLEAALNYINQNLFSDLSVSSISENIHISKSCMYRLFHSHLGCTVNDYINKQRIEKSKKLLTETDLTIENISQKTGFSSMSYYTRTFKKLNNITPLKFRKRNIVKKTENF